MQHLMTIQELSEYLGIKVNTLYSWVSQKKIPYIKVGRLVRFSSDKISEWIQENEISVFKEGKFS